MKRLSAAVCCWAWIGLVIWTRMGARGAGSGSDLEVGPTNLVFDVLAGDPTPTTQTFELRSLSGSEQSWFTSVNWPQLIRVDPASGSLAASEKANLTVSVLASNVWPSKGGYAGDISIMPWGRPKVSFHIRTRPSARLTGAPGALSFGLAPDGVAFKRELPLRNSGFDTPGAGLVLFDDFFRVVKDPSSDPAWQDHWWIYISISGMNLVLTNQESRVFPVTAGYDWDLPPGRYRATLISDAPWQLADALALPLELVVGEDFIAVDRLTPVPGTVLAEQSKVVFDAQVRCQVQSVESGRVRLIVYDPGGVSAIGYSDWVDIDRLSGQSNLVLQTPPVTIHRYSNVVVKAALTVYHRDGYDWKYSDAYVYPVSTNAAVTNVIVIGEKLQLPGRFEPVSTNHIKVEFERSADGTNYVAEAPVEALTATTVTVRVPVNLLGRNDAVPAATGFASNVTVRITTGLPQNPQVSVLPVFWLLPPRLLIHDEVFVAPGAPAGAAPPVPTTPSTLLQFRLNRPAMNDPATLATFMFLGRATDGRMGLRVLNTALGALASARPLRFGSEVRLFQPQPGGTGFELLTPFQLPGQMAEDQAVQFDVLRDGLHVVLVGSEPSSSGPFPAPFQIHLAGNVGLPRKLVNDAAESPRGTRLDTVFNSPAPRFQTVVATTAGSAETAPFKFASVVSSAPFAVGVLVPPAADGFPAGTRVVRAPDPPVPLEVTVPTARTPGIASPSPGMVIDFTQLPDPASVVPAPSLTGTVGAVLGRSDGLSVTLPLARADGTQISSLILDMGSGHEIADGPGADAQVIAPSGTYTVAVANSPYAGDWIALGGTFNGQADLDLHGTGLSLVRFVRVSAAPSATLDAIHKLNMACDASDSQVGPVAQVSSATILVRRAKAPETPLDPFAQLLAPNGELLGQSESGFGDDLSQDRSDAALVRMSLPASSYYRYLVKGYDQVPDGQSTGSFFTRLETEGTYDPVEFSVSALSEADTAPQKRGRIDRARQRDSYLFQANPGTRVHLAVNALTSTLDPMVELFDPEEFLLGANDRALDRGPNALLSVTLPSLSAAGAALPVPSTYRIAVLASDHAGEGKGAAFGTAFLRIAAQGEYELKVFTGDVNTVVPARPVEPALRRAAAALFGKSVRFHPATVSADGMTFTLQLDSAFTGEVPNGELYPLDEESPTHSSGFILTGTGVLDPVFGDLFLDVPLAADINQNQVPDFFETRFEVARVTTYGAYLAADDEGGVEAVWSRPSGSAVGTCRLTLTSTTTGPYPEFESTFELLEYQGELTYEPSPSLIRGSLALVRVSIPNDTLAGPVQLSRLPERPFDLVQLEAGRWTNGPGAAWIFETAKLSRPSATSSLYTGPFLAADGDLATVAEDYYDWFLLISDLNDADRDGIPDLSDDEPLSPPDRPRLGAAVETNGKVLRLTLEGRPGSVLALETCAALGVEPWTTLSLVSLTASPQVLELHLDSGSRFYRLREQ